MESAVGWGYEGYGGLGQRWQWTERSRDVTSWGERLTHISAEITDVKRVVVVVVVEYLYLKLHVIIAMRRR